MSTTSVPPSLASFYDVSRSGYRVGQGTGLQFNREKLNRFRSSGGTVTANDAQASSASAIGATVFGQLAGVYSKFHEVQMAQIETRQRADQMGHRARMLLFDRRAAFQQAEDELRAGQEQIGMLGLEGEQRRAAIKASTAARGIDPNSGSAAEAEASDRLIDAIDIYNINLASVRASNAARREAIAIENEARFARVSERNLRRTARYAQPEAALIGGVLNALSAGYGMGSS